MDKVVNADRLTQLLPFMDSNVMNRLVNAADAALEKHGPLTTDAQRAALILTEEVGEVVEAVLDHTRPSVTDSIRRAKREHLMDELAQVAATAVFMIANLEKEQQ